MSLKRLCAGVVLPAPPKPRERLFLSQCSSHRLRESVDHLLELKCRCILLLSHCMHTLTTDVLVSGESDVMVHVLACGKIYITVNDNIAWIIIVIDHRQRCRRLHYHHHHHLMRQNPTVLLSIIFKKRSNNFVLQNCDRLLYKLDLQNVRLAL